MTRIAVLDADRPLGELLMDAAGYPLRGGALFSLLGLTLCHYLALLPAVGTLIELTIWAGTYLYALECLRQSADGFDQPPEFAEPGHGGWAMVAILLWSVALGVLVPLGFGGGAWLVSLVTAIALPAIAMSLAMDDNVLHALNPLTWLQVMTHFGAHYLLLVGLQLAIALVVGTTQHAVDAALPSIIALPLFYGTATYATFANFRLMGLLIFRRHEALGLAPKAFALAQAGHQDDDSRLLHEVESLAASQPREALALLVPRLRDRSAPDNLHQAYRKLLQQQGEKRALLDHGQLWIAALIIQQQARRALGVLQECIALDASFLPDAPDNCGTLAELAARLGMARLAIHLGRGYLAHWPRAAQAVPVGLLTARILGEHPERRAEALVLLQKLAADWPDHADIASLQRQLAGSA